MESLKIFVSFALLFACAMAADKHVVSNIQEQAVEPSLNPAAVEEPKVAGEAAERVKKQAYYPYYAGYPYSAYPYSGYPYHYYPYSYALPDDGKYYPGKYEKLTYPAAYKSYPYYYPYYY